MDEKIQEVRLKNKNASHDMLFTSIYTERSIALDIQYRTSIFALPFIWNFADHLVWQLNELIQLPDIRLDDLIYQTEYDKQHASLLGDRVYDVLFSIPRMVCAHPKDKIAFYTKNEIMRYGELQEYMGKIGDMLLDKKLTPGTYVGIHALRDWRIIACMFGVMSVGSSPKYVNTPTELKNIDN